MIINEQILPSLVNYVERVRHNPPIAESCLRARSVESLVLRNKIKSTSFNFIYGYQEILNFFRSADLIKTNHIVLDVCCGLGFFTNVLSQSYPKVKGIDLNEYYLKFAEENNLTNGHKAEFGVHNINFPLPADNYHIILSIFGISIAEKPIGVVIDFIKNKPEYIVLFDGNASSAYRFFYRRRSGIDFDSIEKTLSKNNYKILLHKNVHTVPSFLIDLNYIGPFFKLLSSMMRNFDMFSGSRLIIARNSN